MLAYHTALQRRPCLNRAAKRHSEPENSEDTWPFVSVAYVAPPDYFVEWDAGFSCSKKIRIGVRIKGHDESQIRDQGRVSQSGYWIYALTDYRSVIRKNDEIEITYYHRGAIYPIILR